MRPKIVYFAERHRLFDSRQFTQRWRQHGRLGAALPRWRNVARYTQCDRIEGGLDGLEIACDGVATVLFHSEETRLAHIADPDGAITKADEAETFARPVRDVSVLTEPYEVMAGQAGAGLKMFVAVRRKADIPADRFARHWLGNVANHLKTSFSQERIGCDYIQNLRRSDWAASGVGFDADCVDEIAAPDPAAVWKIYRSTLADVAADCIRDIRFVLTFETVLSDVTTL